MGATGPIPKRDAERRRRNKPDTDTTTVEMTGEVVAPDVDRSWHPLAREWYESLAKSGQSKYFEPSDWAAARILAHDMTRHLANRRPSSQWFAAVWSAMADLLTTEGSRRRVRMEIVRKAKKDESAEGELATVTPIDRYSVL
jgi:hypothetical protein